MTLTAAHVFTPDFPIDGIGSMLTINGNDIFNGSSGIQYEAASFGNFLT